MLAVGVMGAIAGRHSANREHRDSTGENGHQRTRRRRASLGKHDRGASAILANRLALLNDDCVSLVWGAEPLGDMDGLGDTRNAICAAARRAGGLSRLHARLSASSSGGSP